MGVEPPEALFDSVDGSDTKRSEKPEIEGDVSSDDEESRNDDSKKDRCTWTESLQEYLHVSDHVEANDSLITISRCVTQVGQLKNDGSSDCPDTSTDDNRVPGWFGADASMEVTVDAGFEDSCMSEDELVAACQTLGWQAMEITDLLALLYKVKQSRWQGIETQLLMVRLMNCYWNEVSRSVCL